MRAVLAPLALLAAFAAPAWADTTALRGDSLVLNTGLDATVSIQPDPALSHEVRVTSDTSCRGMLSEGTAIIVTTDACEGDSGSMTVAVPVGFTVTVASHGDGDVRVGNTHGPLTATLAGGGKLIGGEVGPLTVVIRGDGDVTVEQVDQAFTSEITGSGNVRVRRLAGALHSVQRGSGDLAIGEITAPIADLTIEGSGSALLGRGRIATLTAAARGSGDLGVSAVVGDARVSAAGGSDIKLGTVTGRLDKEADGGSTISVGAGVLSAGLGKLADMVSNPANDSAVNIDIHGGGDTAWHVISAAIVVALLFLLWRTVQRRGGIAAVQARMRQPGSPAAASHPGVIAVRDTVSRLDARLAKLESYVTSREFDLQRKFRELDTH